MLQDPCSRSFLHSSTWGKSFLIHSEGEHLQRYFSWTKEIGSCNRKFHLCKPIHPLGYSLYRLYLIYVASRGWNGNEQTKFLNVCLVVLFCFALFTSIFLCLVVCVCVDMCWHVFKLNMWTKTHKHLFCNPFFHNATPLEWFLLTQKLQTYDDIKIS